MVDGSVRGGDFSWPQAGASPGHHWGPHLATSGDFFMATDRARLPPPKVIDAGYSGAEANLLELTRPPSSP
jgi:hypothetical protein